MNTSKISQLIHQQKEKSEHIHQPHFNLEAQVNSGRIKHTQNNTMKKHKYSSGPCILPQEVFEK